MISNRLLEKDEEIKPIYEFSNGCRKVKPYIFSYSTHAKERWYGKEILQVYSSEFAAFSESYYNHAIITGKLTVNGYPVKIDYIIKNGDYMSHRVHRHEPPVVDTLPVIIFEDDLFIAFNKPSSIPVHACGVYRCNSLDYIIRSIRPDIQISRFIHRLDRLTSGVLIMAKQANQAAKMSKLISSSQTSKLYIARIQGILKDITDLQATAQLKCKNAEITQEKDGRIRINCPVRCLNKKQAILDCYSDGKPSETIIRVIRYIRGTTVVECQPITGRSHQIRLHLQLIGFPIANDSCYGGILNFEEKTDVVATITTKNSLATEISTLPQQENETELEFMKRTCWICMHGDEQGQNKAKLHCAQIWLHAFNYKIAGREFIAPMPTWSGKEE